MKKLFLFALFISFSSFAHNEASMKEMVHYLSAAKMQGRVTGTPENAEVQDWLIEKFNEFDVKPARIDGYRYHFRGNGWDHDGNPKAVEGMNIVGIIYPNNSWSNEKPRVLIGAHFDHHDHCTLLGDDQDVVCNGATDNATSVAIMVSLLKELPYKIKHPVAVAFWDGEEQGLVGSHEFFKNPMFDLNEINLYINLDIVGLNLFKGLENNHFIIGTETGGEALNALVREAVKDEAHMSYKLPSYAFGHGRSDMTSLVRLGYQIPFLFFSDGDGKVYHTNKDEPEFVNYEKIVSIARVIENITVKASEYEKGKLLYKTPEILFDRGTRINSFLQKILSEKWGFALRNGIPGPEISDIEIVLGLYDEILIHAEENALTEELMAKINEERNSVLKLRGKKKLNVLNKFSLLKSASLVTYLSKQLSFIP